jgi:putative inorganic carbon (hco3(-)) transporter
VATGHAHAHPRPYGLRLPRRRRDGSRAPPLAWAGFAAVAGLGIGAAATLDLTIALPAAVALALAPLLLLYPASLIPLVVVVLYLQATNFSGVTIDRLIAPVALFVVVTALLRGAAFIRGGNPLVWVLAYSLWALASTLWTVHLGETGYLLASLVISLVYMLVFAALVASERDLVRILVSVAVASCGVGLIAIVTFQGTRSVAASGDPNFFAALELVAMPLVLAAAGIARARWIRAALYTVVVVLVIAVLTTLSRGGLLTLATIVFFILALPAGSFLRSRAQKVAVVAVLTLAGTVAYSVVAQDLVPRIQHVFTEEGKTGSGRLNAWRAAWLSIQERPVLGLGYGGFDPVANDLMLRTPGVDLANFELRAGGLKAHSAYIGTAAELGIPGLLLFLGIVGSTLRALRRTAARAREEGAALVARIANALFVALAGWSVASLFLSSETARPLWVILGLALALPKLLDRAAGRRTAAAG